MPEIALLLVKEDIGVNNVKARSILKENIEIGEILNEGENNRIDY